MLFHDIGKPATLTVDEDGITHFYGHPAVGEEMAQMCIRDRSLSGGEDRSGSIQEYGAGTEVHERGADPADAGGEFPDHGV